MEYYIVIDTTRLPEPEPHVKAIEKIEFIRELMNEAITTADKPGFKMIKNDFEKFFNTKFEDFHPELEGHSPSGNQPGFAVARRLGLLSMQVCSILKELSIEEYKKVQKEYKEGTGISINKIFAPAKLMLNKRVIEETVEELQNVIGETPERTSELAKIVSSLADKNVRLNAKIIKKTEKAKASIEKNRDKYYKKQERNEQDEISIEEAISNSQKAKNVVQAIRNKKYK